MTKVCIIRMLMCARNTEIDQNVRIWNRKGKEVPVLFMQMQSTGTKASVFQHHSSNLLWAKLILSSFSYQSVVLYMCTLCCSTAIKPTVVHKNVMILSAYRKKFVMHLFFNIIRVCTARFFDFSSTS